MPREELENLYKQRLEFINSPSNKEEMEQLKKDFTFHSLKFEDGMEPWFDLWKRRK